MPLSEMDGTFGSPLKGVQNSLGTIHSRPFGWHKANLSSNGPAAQKTMASVSDQPFLGTISHTQPFFTANSHGHVWRTLRNNLAQGEGVIVITGEAGIGKSQLLLRLQGLLPENWDIALIENGNQPHAQFTQTLCEAVGANIAGPHAWSITTSELLDAVANRVEFGRNFLVVIDQADQLTQENINILNNLLLFAATQSSSVQIILAGRPELSRHLDLPTFQLLRNAIITMIEIPPLTRVEVWEYIRFQTHWMLGKKLKITWPAWLELFAASHGNPHKINLLLQKVLFLNTDQTLKFLTGPLVRRGRMTLDANYHPAPGRRLTPWAPLIFALLLVGYFIEKPYFSIPLSLQLILNPKPAETQPAEPTLPVLPHEADKQEETQKHQTVETEKTQPLTPANTQEKEKQESDQKKEEDKKEAEPVAPSVTIVEEAPPIIEISPGRPLPDAKPLRRSAQPAQ